MGKMRSWSVRGLLAASFFVSAVALAPVIPTAQAATQEQTGMFRVALYISSGKFNTTVPSVGLSSPGGLKIGVRSNGSEYSWFSVPANKSFRANLDQYQIKVLETGDFKQAQAALTAVGIKANAVIYLNSVQGKPVYQVFVGDYLTKENAQLTLTELLKTPASAVYAQKASISGPLHLSAGTYATESEARTKAASLRLAGIPVDITFQGNAAGSATYSLWVGSEADADALSALKTKLEATAKGIKLTAVNAGAAYFIEKEEVSATASGSGGAAHYLFNPVDQKALITPVSGKITVQEKNLSYNGSVELSRLNGKLAVINQLPFEQYLYSVVHAELGPGYPKEALKAQAVAARTYSAKAGMKYEIANLTDTTLDQAYFGKEAADVTEAVNETKGEVLKIDNVLIDTLFSSNSGGQTADGSEAWGYSVPYLQSVDSPDTYPQQGKLPWYRIFRDNGTSGYVRSDLLSATSSITAGGLPLYTATDNANVRTIPAALDSLSPSLGKLEIGEQVAVISTADESTSYSWTRLLTAAQLLPKINASYPLNNLQTLEVAKRGVSGRVMGLLINGNNFTLKAPDGFRSMLGGLPSTLFEIEETGRYTVLGATGARTEVTGASTVYAATGTNNAAVTGNEFLILNGQGNVRLATGSQQFLFTGKGYGHGLGMSQFGAVGMALEGKDYVSILTHYYSGATIVKQ
ncbi:MAG: SpoIID/LytB domain-containing protein [Gorillibacterium sp.]|nr:SpoIID/LytB domain-containing protein [Gorillibacterium sp.]